MSESPDTAHSPCPRTPPRSVARYHRIRTTDEPREAFRASPSHYSPLPSSEAPCPPAAGRRTALPSGSLSTLCMAWAIRRSCTRFVTLAGLVSQSGIPNYHPVRDPLKSPMQTVRKIGPDLAYIILYWNSSACARAARNLHATNLPVVVCVFSVNFQNSEFRISIPPLYVYFQSIFRNMLPQ
eukprot:COSAG05_NODE_646_length_8119_cov_236.689900_15_plen_182_part_00